MNDEWVWWLLVQPPRLRMMPVGGSLMIYSVDPVTGRVAPAF